MWGRPLIAVTLAFALGILTASYALPVAWIGIAAQVIALVLYALTKRPLWGSAGILLGFFLLGSARSLLASALFPDDISRLAPHLLTLTGVVDSEVEEKSSRTFGEEMRRTAHFTFRAEAVETAAGRERKVSGKVRVTAVLPTEIQDTSVVKNGESRKCPDYGDRLRLHGLLRWPDGERNPGAFDYRRFLAQRNIHVTLTTKRPEDCRILSPMGLQGNLFLKVAYDSRERILSHPKESLPPVHAAVLNGILLGARADLPGTLRDDFERTGTTHILATAGLHTGMVVLLLLGLQKRLRVARRQAQLLTLFALLLYVVMAGGRPSVARAVIIGIVYLLGPLLEREPDLPNALALAAFLLLAWNPHYLMDPGFQMSFATVVTIILLMPLAEHTLKWAQRRIRGSGWGRKTLRGFVESILVCFFLALTAQIGAMPLVAYYFHQVSLVSVPANTLVVPLIPSVIGLGFLASGLSLLHPLLAWPLDRVLDALLVVVIYCVQGSARLPFAGVNAPSPPLPLILAYYALVWGGAFLLQRRYGEKRRIGEEPRPAPSEEEELWRK